VIIAALYAILCVLIPVGFCTSGFGPGGSVLTDWGSTAFWTGSVGLLLLLLVGVILQKEYPAGWYIRPFLPKAENPASMHDAQLLLLTTFFPGAMMVGFLYTARYLLRDFLAL